MLRENQNFKSKCKKKSTTFMCSTHSIIGDDIFSKKSCLFQQNFHFLLNFFCRSARFFGKICAV